MGRISTTECTYLPIYLRSGLGGGFRSEACLRLV